MTKNKTITPFVFAAALLVAMLASTGIAHAQDHTVTYTSGQTAIEGDSFLVNVNGPSVLITFEPLKQGTYTAVLDGATNSVTVTGDNIDDTANIFFTTSNYVGNAVLSFGGSKVVEQIVRVQAPPTIVLSGPLAGNPDDRITRNRGIDITLASDFDAGRGDTWGISVDGGADNYARTKVDNANNAPNLHFGLGDGEYTNNQIRVRQTVNGVTSTFAGLAAFTFDRTAPTIDLTGAASITLKVGESYTDLGATVTDNLDTAIQSKLDVGGDTVSTATPGTYTITYDATDHADNTAAQVTREVIVPVRLGFAAGGQPVLTSDGEMTDGVTYAKFGDMLTLTFTVNQALASSPTVTIDGTTVTADNPAGDNEFIATHSVLSRVVEFGLSTRNGVPVRYDIDEMVADGDTGNTFDPDEAEYPDTILIDVTPAAVAIPRIPRGVVSDLQRYDITFLEPVTGLEVGDFSDSTDLTVSDVSPVSGPGIDPGTQYTITFTPNAETFIFAVDGGSVTDRAGNPSPARTTSKGGFADPATNTPTADAGPAQRVDTGASVTLDGSGSSDPDGTIAGYAWTQPSGTTVALTGADTAGPTFTAPATAATLTFSLIVTDNDGDGSTADTVVITVIDPAADNTAPVITFDRFEQTGGVDFLGSAIYLNVDDTLTVFVNSGELLAESSLVGAAFFDFEGSNRPVQNLLRVAGTTDPYQYSATYTITTADHDAEPQFNVRGVTDTADTANTAADFAHPLTTVNIDTGTPTITLDGSSPVTVAHGGTYTEAEDAGISGTGSSDTTAVTTTRPDATTVDGIVVDTNTAGDYTITYTATDRAGNVSNSVTRTVTVSAPAGATNTAPVITFARFEHTGGVEVGTGTFLNAGDTLTAFVNSDEPLAESSLVGAAFFGFDTTARPVQNLLRVGDTNQYSATYTITPAEDDTAAGFNVRGVTDTADPANTASDFRHPFLGTVTIDTVAPTITLVGGPVTVAHGGTYTDAEDAGISGAGRSDTTATTTRPDATTVDGIVVDTNTAGDYLITYTVTDRAGNVSNSVTRTVTVTEPGATNTRPVVSGNAAPNYAENTPVTTPVATYTTTDTNTIAWSVGGTDASLFAIDPTSGVLTFRVSPNFEDAHGPTYSITITATETDGDPNNLTGTQAVTVTVTNVDEDGTATIAGTAKVDVMLTASVTDPDGAVTGVTHAWQSAPDGTNTYTAISGAGTDAAYTPGVDDVGKTIQVIATYTDPQGSGKMATSTPTAAVLAADAEPPGPAPGIALKRDTAADGGENTDRRTRNRDIDVTLASGFDTNSDTWEYSTDGGATAFLPGTGTSFTLPKVSADYAADQVRVRQTVNSVVSAFAGLAAFTIDADVPGADLGTIAGAVIDQGGQTHAITFSENVFGLAAGDFSASAGITVTAVSGSDGGTDYTITYTATAASFNLILAAGSVTDLVAWPVALTPMTGTATATNTAPTADAGDDQEVLTGAAPVTLDGSGTDDGTIAGYAWTQDSGTTVTLSSTTTAPTFTAPDATTALVFSLIVTDNDGANSAADTVTITVSAPPATNQRPVVSGEAAPNYAENADAAVATYAATDVENNAIAWSVTGTDAGLFAIDPTSGALTYRASPNFEDAHGPTYSITITATETDGDPGNLTGELAVTVTVTNVDEEGSIGAITGTAQVGVALTAGMVTDPDGAVTGITYQWQSVESGATTNIGTGMTYTPGVGDEGKTIQVIATYTDPQGANKTATSAATAAVIAAPVTNQPPVAHAGFDQRNVDIGAVMVMLDGSGSTGDGLAYEWTVPMALGGPINLSSTTAVRPTFTAPTQANDLVFTLTVTDNDGVTDTDMVTIFVTGADEFRIALADDTGIDGDGITSNGLVNVSNPGGSWRYTTNSGTTFSTIQSEATTSFTLDEDEYDANDVVANQVGEGDAGTAELGAVTVDTTAPTVETFATTIAPGVIGTPQMHDITFSEALDFASVGRYK